MHVSISPEYNIIYSFTITIIQLNSKITWLLLQSAGLAYTLSLQETSPAHSKSLPNHFRWGKQISPSFPAFFCAPPSSLFWERQFLPLSSLPSPPPPPSFLPFPPLSITQ